MTTGAADQSFVHLHVHTEYSLLDGASRIKPLLERAGELAMPALAITDHGSMYGVIDFYKAAKKQGVKPLIGCEVYVAQRTLYDRAPKLDDSPHHLVLLAKDLEGYRNLTALVSQAYLDGFYYKPRIDLDLLSQHSGGLIGLSACLGGAVPKLILSDQDDKAREMAMTYRDILGPDNYYLELQDHGFEEQHKVNRHLIKLAQESGLPLVATNDIHYVRKEQAYLQDVLMCIQMGKTLDDPNRMHFDGSEFYLKDRREMEMLFGEHPEALNNTLRIAERCNVDFSFGENHLPRFELPQDRAYAAWKERAGELEPSLLEVLRQEEDYYLLFLTEQGLAAKGLDRRAHYRERLIFEVRTICTMGFSGYFLIVQDFVNYAKANEILVGPGRGSAAGSLVSYALGITDIDPIQYDLLFERFLNPERVSMPDIDIDFCFERRGEVIDYVVRKYGSDRVAQIITFGTMAAKAAVRDVGRAMNIPLGMVDKVAKAIPQELGMTIERALEVSPDLQGLYRESPELTKLVDTAKAIEGMPRHASTHAAGVVIAKEPLVNYLPVQRTSEGGVTTQYPKDTVEEIGLLKMDLLGLKTLTLTNNVLKNIGKAQGIHLTTDDFPLDDPKTYELLGVGESLGVFQLESSGLRAILKELKPSAFSDIVALVALYRPGPLGSGMVEDFIKRKHGETTVTYMHPLLEPILKDTYGVILYQEQVMRIASDLAGFTLGEADLLRRAMGKKKPEVIAGLRQQFVSGAEQRGIPEKVAGPVFDLMEHFAGYGFNKSHSAAYAMIAFQTAYLKANYPVEFMAALLTSVADNADKISLYIEECRRMAIPVLAPDVNHSEVDFTVVGQEIRFGLAAVKNVGRGAIAAILEARQKGGPSLSLEDFCGRVDSKQANRRVLESLIKGGALATLGRRRSLLMILDACLDAGQKKQKDEASGQISLFDMGGSEAQALAIPLPDIEDFPPKEILAMEKEYLGLYISGHPLDEYRHRLGGGTPVAQLEGVEGDKKVTLIGLVTALRRMVTKKGQTMAHFVLEDLTGSVPVLVFPKTYMRLGAQLQEEQVIRLEGRLNVEDEERKIFCETFGPLVAEGEEGGREAEKARGDQGTARESGAPYSPRPEGFSGDPGVHAVQIRVPAASDNQPFTEQLQAILKNHRGSCPVILLFLEDRKAIQTHREYWVTPGPALEKALEELCGPKTYKTVAG